MSLNSGSSPCLAYLKVIGYWLIGVSLCLKVDGFIFSAFKLELEKKTFSMINWCFEGFCWVTIMCTCFFSASVSLLTSPELHALNCLVRGWVDLHRNPAGVTSVLLLSLVFALSWSSSLNSCLLKTVRVGYCWWWEDGRSSASTGVAPPPYFSFPH